MEWIADPTIWLGLGTLVLLEIVLGVDNLIFIAILTDRLPAEERNKARFVGLSLALLTRLALLAGISWLQSLTTPFITVLGFALSVRDLILIGGGLFLLFKGTTELHRRLEGVPHESKGGSAQVAFWQVIVQIVLLDIVFSLDSVITAVGMVDELPVMMIAVIVAVGVMLWAGRALMDFVGRHATVVILCLSFLLMIGLSLVLDGFGIHIPKAYLYTAIAFSVAVEGLNQIAQRNLERNAASENLRARAADAILRILGGGRANVSPTEDIAPLLAARDAGGVFAPEERAIMQRVLGLGERTAASLMTGASEVVWLDVDADAEALQCRILETGHAAYPVCRGNLKNLLGVARAPALVSNLLQKGRIETESLERRPLIVSERMSALRVIELLRRASVQMAIVTDEFGTIRGVASPTDILVAIVGAPRRGSLPA
jgi:predicted tellurium resistance membrane protein TerC